MMPPSYDSDPFRYLRGRPDPRSQFIDDIARLFLNGEQGLWLDPSDLSTLFQDTAGVVPVMGPGQTVARALDKHSGLQRGPELVVNGDFASSAGYTEVLGGAISYANQTMLATGATSNTGVYQDVAVVAGRSYQVSWRQVSGTSNRVGIYNGASFSSPLYTNGTGDTITGTRSAIVLPTATVLRIYLSTAAGYTAEFDNLSVRELPGNHLVQPVALSRPTLGRHPVGGRRNLARYTDCVGAAWTAAGTTPPTWVATTRFGKPCMAVTFPNGLTDAGYAGSRVTYNGGAFSASIPNTFSARYVVSTSRPLAAGEYFTLQHNGAFATSAINVVRANEGLASTEWKVFDFTGSSATVATGIIFPVVSAGTTNNGPLTVYLTEVQWEIGTTTPYQKVTSDWDVTEVGKADCWYLGFDGVDDFMVSAASLDLSATDKVTMFAGAQKFTDAAIGIVAEFSANAGAVGVAGTFYLLNGDGTRRWSTYGRGTIGILAYDGTAAPDAAVLTVSHDIAGDLSTLRRNGVRGVDGAGDMGAGNFGNYLLYVGRRGGTSLPFNGRIYQLPIRGAATPDAQVAAVEAQIAAKMGITL